MSSSSEAKDLPLLSQSPPITTKPHPFHNPPRDIINPPMPGTNTKLTTAVEQYFSDLRSIRASGGGALKPKVFCAPRYHPTLDYDFRR